MLFRSLLDLSEKLRVANFILIGRRIKERLEEYQGKNNCSDYQSNIAKIIIIVVGEIELPLIIPSISVLSFLSVFLLIVTIKIAILVQVNSPLNSGILR